MVKLFLPSTIPLLYVQHKWYDWLVDWFSLKIKWNIEDSSRSWSWRHEIRLWDREKQFIMTYCSRSKVLSSFFLFINTFFEDWSLGFNCMSPWYKLKTGRKFINKAFRILNLGNLSGQYGLDSTCLEKSVL